MPKLLKEIYFTAENIDDWSKKMLATLPRSSRFRLSDSRSALIVIDMQRYFLDEDSHAFIPSSPAICSNIFGLIRAFLDNKRPVILTRHINSYENAAMMGKWWSEIITYENPFSMLIPELEQVRAFRIDKTQYDCFYQTELDEILRANGVEQVVIAGIATNLCCETTARSSFVHGYETFFAIDATATYALEFHKATLRNLSAGFAIPMSTKEIEKCLKSM